MIGRRKSKQILPPLKKKKRSTSSIEEIAFDHGARADYLTGFHKRKLQRIKHAQGEAAKKEREERIAARKILRDGRKVDLEKHVKAVNSMLRDADGEAGTSHVESEDSQIEEWGGIAELSEIDHEAEYIDEDRYTTVTVEAVDISKDGFHKSNIESEEEDEVASGLGKDAAAAKDSTDKEDNKTQKGKRVWTKERPNGPKKRKKKFKYESKAERKVTRHKEKSGNKAKAKARKE